ncbi:MAG: acyl-CoA dehydrogenase family protein, partial [Cyclobacteriaceae bacterium]
GMGFSADAPMDRAYRDARINRIFEGTNEINRMLTIDMVLRRAMKGHLDLMGPAMAIQKELTSVPDFGGNDDDSLFAKEKKLLNNLKKAGLMVAGAAVQKFMDKLKGEQEILMNLADMLIMGYTAESALLRTEKLADRLGNEAVSIQVNMTKLYLGRAIEQAASAGREAINGFASGDEQRLMLLGLKRFTKQDPVNLIELRRRIADYVIEKNDYPF